MPVPRLPLLSLLLGAILLLAGCAGGGAAAPKTTGPSTTADDPKAGADSGSVTGQVLDDEARPIAAATVLLLKLGRETETDANGRYTINDVPPGRHELFVQRLGYEPQGKVVEVQAGAVVEAKFALRSLAVDQEWHYVERTSRNMIAGSYVSVYPNNAQTWNLKWTLKDDPNALGDLFLEADWNPSTTLADGIRFYSGIGTWNSDKPLCVGMGHDPYKCRVTPEARMQDWGCDFREDKKSCVGEWMFRPGGSRLTSQHVGLWPQDTVTVYISHFFRQAAPDDYTALP